MMRGMSIAGLAVAMVAGFARADAPADPGFQTIEKARAQAKEQLKMLAIYSVVNKGGKSP